MKPKRPMLDTISLKTYLDQPKTLLVEYASVRPIPLLGWQLTEVFEGCIKFGARGGVLLFVPFLHDASPSAQNERPEGPSCKTTHSLYQFCDRSKNDLTTYNNFATILG
jgi:hypothetical protein